MEMTKELKNKLMQNGYTVETNTFEKNGTTRLGYIIQKENSKSRVSPIFYDFPNDVDEAFNYIVNCMPTNTEDFEDYSTEEYARNNVYLIALTEGKNKNFATRPSEFKGIEMGLAFDVTVEGISGMVRITNDLAERYTNLDELWDIATKNTASDIQIDCFDGLGTMYVLSNNEMIQGAGTMFTNRAKDMLREKFKDRVNKLVLIPSSIHEWIILPMLTMFEKDTRNFVSMVKEMNETVVEESERLTDNAYIYDFEEDTITSLA